MDDRNTRDSAFVEDDSSETAGEKNGECYWVAIFIFIPKLQQIPISVIIQTHANTWITWKHKNSCNHKKDPTQNPNSKHKLTASSRCLVSRKSLALFHFGSPFSSKRLWFVQLWTLSCDLFLTHVLWLSLTIKLIPRLLTGAYKYLQIEFAK